MFHFNYIFPTNKFFIFLQEKHIGNTWRVSIQIFPKEKSVVAWSVLNSSLLLLLLASLLLRSFLGLCFALLGLFYVGLHLGLHGGYLLLIFFSKFLGRGHGDTVLVLVGHCSAWQVRVLSIEFSLKFWLRCTVYKMSILPYDESHRLHKFSTLHLLLYLHHKKSEEAMEILVTTKKS